MQRIARSIDKLSAAFSAVAEVLLFTLVLLTVEQVIARYFFGNSSIALQELEWHLFGYLFMFCMASTLNQDGHVRVDLFYSHFSKKNRLLVDLLSLVLFIIPSCIVIAYFGWDFAVEALSFSTARADDYYCSSFFNSAGFFYSPCSSIEGILRHTILVGESSPDPGGLEARWLIKIAIPLGFGLLLLQAIAELSRKVIALSGFKGEQSGD